MEENASDKSKEAAKRGEGGANKGEGRRDAMQKNEGWKGEGANQPPAYVSSWRDCSFVEPHAAENRPRHLYVYRIAESR